MGDTTKIEWCDATINCFWGCRKGCSYCQARSMAKRFGKRIGTKRGYSPEVITKMANFEPVFLDDQLDKIKTIRKPSRIFMSFMGEPFSPEFEDDLPVAFQAIRDFPEHTFLMLTKRPQNLIKWRFPDNVWIGQSITGREFDLLERLRTFTDIRAKVKFLSLEPLLMYPDMRGTLVDKIGRSFTWQELINWVIIGAQTPYNQKTFPKYEWVSEIINACDNANIPIFLKNNLRLPKYSCKGAIPFYKKSGGTMELRQEFPK